MAGDGVDDGDALDEVDGDALDEVDGDALDEVDGDGDGDVVGDGDAAGDLAGEGVDDGDVVGVGVEGTRVRVGADADGDGVELVGGVPDVGRAVGAGVDG